MKSPAKVAAIAPPAVISNQPAVTNVKTGGLNIAKLNKLAH